MLVLFCTFLNAIAQVCFKKGAGTLDVHPSLIDAALGIITKPILFGGYALLGISTVLFILALRKGELSLLFPVFTLGYVWVTILSAVLFQESMNVFKIGGVAVIIFGVAILGGASRQ